MVAQPKKIGRYEIRKELGRGMMGVVYEAHDPALTRTVALKTIHPSVAASEEGREAFERRFENEARAAGRLSHPNIVMVYDVGRDPETGVLYIALERLHGEPLSQLISQGKRLHWREVLHIGQQIAEALAHLHSQGVVHRDIKPANVMRLPAVPGRAHRPIKLMDFGIAKVDAARLTAAGQFFGTPLYMAPEQAASGTVDARSDIFSLGSVLYTLLAGRDAFAANNVLVILQRVMNEDPEPPTSIDDTLPGEVDDIIARCLAKDPADRYPGARQLAEDLTDVLEGRPPRHREGWTPPPRRPAPTVAGTLQSPLETIGPTLTVDPAEASGKPPSAPAAATGSPWRGPALYADIAVVVAVLAFAIWVTFRPGGIGRREVRAESPGASAAATPPAPSLPTPAIPTPTPTAAVPEPTPAAAPEPTLAAVPEPTPKPTPVPAQIVVDVEHPLRRARLRIDMDGTPILEETLEGDVDKNLLVLKTHGGQMTRLLELKPGRHRMDVEIAWDDDVRRKAIGARFLPGETYRLVIRMGRLRKNLSLEWTR